MEGKTRLDGQEQVKFDRIVAAIGSETLAILCCCAMFDVPFIEECIPMKGDDLDLWMAYKKKLRSKKHGDETFKDGATDLTHMFAGGVSAEEIPQIILAEQKQHPEAETTGTKEQVRTWGVGNETDPFSQEDYDRLDDLFDTYSSRLVSTGGMDIQQEDTLRQVSIMRLKRDKLITAGDKDSVAMAKSLDAMIKENLSSEQLRKADAKPVEDVRIDSIMDALEKWGAVKNGKILSFPQLTEFLLKELGRLGGEPAHRYTQTLDAADWELLFIQNCMATNEDRPKWMELPDNMRFSEEVANEFSPEPTDDEKRAYEGIGIIRNRKQKKGRKKKAEG